MVNAEPGQTVQVEYEAVNSGDVDSTQTLELTLDDGTVTTVDSVEETFPVGATGTGSLSYNVTDYGNFQLCVKSENSIDCIELAVFENTYIVAGRDVNSNRLNSAEKYVSGGWNNTPNATSVRQDPGATSTLDYDIVVSGGFGDPFPVATVEVFDGSTWSSLPDMPIEKVGHGMATDSSGDIYTIAGSDGSNDLSRVDVWDGSGWVSRGTVDARQGVSACADVNGDIYVVGGGTSTVEKYDGTSWSNIQSLPVTLDSTSIAADRSGNVYTIGGTTGSGETDAIYRWDGISWTQVATLPNPTRGLAACTGGGDNIYISGGFLSSTSNPTVEAFLFDGTSISSLPTINTARELHGAAGTQPHW